MRNIGMLIGSLEGGGAERVALNLANEFAKRKIPFTLILRFKKGPYVKQLNSNIHVLELTANNPIIIVFKLIKACKKNQIDVLFAISRYNNILALIANFVLRKRTIIREATTFDGFYKKKTINKLERVKSQLFLKLIQFLYPKADAIVANSKDTAKDIENHISVSGNKIVVINNPLIDDQIQTQSNQPVDDEYFSNTSTPRIISAGRLVYQKNFQHLIKSFALLKKTMPSASLTILGEGPQETQLKELVKQLDLGNDVCFLGFVDNPYKYLKHADVFVLSSIFEGFGNVLVESLAIGLPVVSTNCPGGPREILDNGKFGALVPVNDEKAMSIAIIRVLAAKTDKQKLIDRSKIYSIEKITDKYFEVLSIS